MFNINEIQNNPYLQNVISAEDFFFQKGQDALKKWLAFEIPEELSRKLIGLANDYKAIQKEANENVEVKTILDLLYTITTYCDSNAKNKHIFNEYEDKRVLAKAFVRMYAWVNHLILFKLSTNSLKLGSTKNAFDYLINPLDEATILSENHRELIAINLFKKPYRPEEFVRELKSYFSPYNLKTNNPSNYTYLLSCIIYSIQDEWKEDTVALMASDGTGWQDEFIEEIDNYEACVIWNSKRPSGVRKTLDSLRKIVEDNSSFNLYYCKSGWVNYKATIIDFVENQKELDEKQWDSQYKILYYNNNFDDYKGDNKKASIVFLAQSLEKIQPIPIDKFEILNGYKYPTQDNLSPIKKEPETIETIEIEVNNQNRINTLNMNQEIKYPLNQILYGPPGTGKTYNTINKALEILQVDIEGKSREDIKKLFEAKVKEGQIVFTTFHQSMSYEDFIEGIKPELKQEGKPINYRVEKGIFREIVEKANENRTLSLLQNPEQNNKIPFEVAFKMLIEKVENAKLDYSETKDESKKGVPIKLPTVVFQIIDINGSSIRMRTSSGGEANGMTQNTLKLIFEDLENIDKYIKGGMKGYYKALVEEMKSWGNEIIASSQDVKLLNYVLIIDEINRGNVSQIFGELITLIEEDKRLGKDEALEVTLPYSKTSFGVPPNLYIIGTMNTADRSVEALDTALRRRFSFEEMPPIPELLSPERKIWELWWQYSNIYWHEEPYKTRENDLYNLMGVDDKNLGDKDTLWYEMKEQGRNESQIQKLKGKIHINGINLEELLIIINKRIEVLLDRDHQIGHSYFMTVGSIKDLQLAFHNKIVPLLQEYFFGDYGKIGLVLGEGFFENVENINENLFATFPRYDASSFVEKDIFELKNIKTMEIDAFKTAINVLLNKKK